MADNSDSVDNKQSRRLSLGSLVGRGVVSGMRNLWAEREKTQQPGGPAVASRATGNNVRGRNSKFNALAQSQDRGLLFRLPEDVQPGSAGGSVASETSLPQSAAASPRPREMQIPDSPDLPDFKADSASASPTVSGKTIKSPASSALKKMWRSMTGKSLKASRSDMDSDVAIGSADKLLGNRLFGDEGMMDTAVVSPTASRPTRDVVTDGDQTAHAADPARQLDLDGEDMEATDINVPAVGDETAAKLEVVQQEAEPLLPGVTAEETSLHLDDSGINAASQAMSMQTATVPVEALINDVQYGIENVECTEIRDSTAGPEGDAAVTHEIHPTATNLLHSPDDGDISAMTLPASQTCMTVDTSLTGAQVPEHVAGTEALAYPEPGAFSVLVADSTVGTRSDEPSSLISAPPVSSIPSPGLTVDVNIPNAQDMDVNMDMPSMCDTPATCGPSSSSRRRSCKGDIPDVVVSLEQGISDGGSTVNSSAGSLTLQPVPESCEVGPHSAASTPDSQKLGHDELEVHGSSDDADTSHVEDVPVVDDVHMEGQHAQHGGVTDEPSDVEQEATFAGFPDPVLATCVAGKVEPILPCTVVAPPASACVQAAAHVSVCSDNSSRASSAALDGPSEHGTGCGDDSISSMVHEDTMPDNMTSSENRHDIDHSMDCDEAPDVPQQHEDTLSQEPLPGVVTQVLHSPGDTAGRVSSPPPPASLPVPVAQDSVMCDYLDSLAQEVARCTPIKSKPQDMDIMSSPPPATMMQEHCSTPGEAVVAEQQATLHQAYAHMGSPNPDPKSCRATPVASHGGQLIDTYDDSCMDVDMAPPEMVSSASPSTPLPTATTTPDAVKVMSSRQDSEQATAVSPVSVVAMEPVPSTSPVLHKDTLLELNATSSPVSKAGPAAVVRGTCTDGVSCGTGGHVDDDSAGAGLGDLLLEMRHMQQLAHGSAVLTPNCKGMISLDDPEEPDDESGVAPMQMSPLYLKLVPDMQHSTPMASPRIGPDGTVLESPIPMARSPVPTVRRSVRKAPQSAHKAVAASVGVSMGTDALVQALQSGFDEVDESQLEQVRLLAQQAGVADPLSRSQLGLLDMSMEVKGSFLAASSTGFTNFLAMSTTGLGLRSPRDDLIHGTQAAASGAAHASTCTPCDAQEHLAHDGGLSPRVKLVDLRESLPMFPRGSMMVGESMSLNRESLASIEPFGNTIAGAGSVSSSRSSLSSSQYLGTKHRTPAGVRASCRILDTLQEEEDKASTGSMTGPAQADASVLPAATSLPNQVHAPTPPDQAPANSHHMDIIMESAPPATPYASATPATTQVAGGAGGFGQGAILSPIMMYADSPPAPVTSTSSHGAAAADVDVFSPVRTGKTAMAVDTPLSKSKQLTGAAKTPAVASKRIAGPSAVAATPSTVQKGATTVGSAPLSARGTGIRTGLRGPTATAAGHKAGAPATTAAHTPAASANHSLHTSSSVKHTVARPGSVHSGIRNTPAASKLAAAATPGANVHHHPVPAQPKVVQVTPGPAAGAKGNILAFTPQAAPRADCSPAAAGAPPPAMAFTPEPSAAPAPAPSAAVPPIALLTTPVAKELQQLPVALARNVPISESPFDFAMDDFLVQEAEAFAQQLQDSQQQAAAAAGGVTSTGAAGSSGPRMLAFGRSPLPSHAAAGFALTPGPMNAASQDVDTPTLALPKLTSTGVGAASTMMKGSRLGMGSLTNMATPVSIINLSSGSATMATTPTTGLMGTLSHSQRQCPSLSPAVDDVQDMQIRALRDKLWAAENAKNEYEQKIQQLEDTIRTLEFGGTQLGGDVDMEIQARQAAEEQLRITTSHLSTAQETVRHLEVQLREKTTALDASTAQAAQLGKELQEAGQKLQDKTHSESTAQSQVVQLRAEASSTAAALSDAHKELAKLKEENEKNKQYAVKYKSKLEEQQADFKKQFDKQLDEEVKLKKKVEEQAKQVQHYTDLALRYRGERDQARTLLAQAQAQESHAVDAQVKAALGHMTSERDQLMRMCEDLMNQLEAVKSGRS